MGANANTLTVTKITEDATVARRMGRLLRPLRQWKLAIRLTPRLRHHLAILLLRRPVAQVLVVIALVLRDFPIDSELEITEQLKTTHI